MIIDESLMFWITRLGIGYGGSNSFYSNIIDMEGTANATLATGLTAMARAVTSTHCHAPNFSRGGTSVEFQLSPPMPPRSCCHVKPGALIPTVILDTTAILTSNVPANFVAAVLYAQWC